MGYPLNQALLVMTEYLELLQEIAKYLRNAKHVRRLWEV